MHLISMTTTREAMLVQFLITLLGLRYMVYATLSTLLVGHHLLGERFPFAF